MQNTGTETVILDFTTLQKLCSHLILVTLVLNPISFKSFYTTEVSVLRYSIL